MLKADPKCWAQALAAAMPSIKDRLAANKFLAERGHGRVPETEIDPVDELQNEELVELFLGQFSDAQLVELFEEERERRMRREEEQPAHE